MESKGSDSIDFVYKAIGRRNQIRRKTKKRDQGQFPESELESTRRTTKKIDPDPLL
jgi:hypothetical protein